MQFVYTAKSKSGDIQTGHISAADVEAVKRALREQSLFAIDIRKKVANSAFKAILGWRDKNALSKRDLLSVTTQLAIMTRSGVDLASAFHVAVAAMQQSDDAEHSGANSQRRDGRQEHFGCHASAGGRVWRCLRGQRGGGRSGRQAAGGARPAGAISADAKCACGRRCGRCWLIRCCLSGVSSLVVIGLVTFVLPKFVDIFGQFEVALPLITQVVVAMSDVMRKHIG